MKAGQQTFTKYLELEFANKREFVITAMHYNLLEFSISYNDR